MSLSTKPEGPLGQVTPAGLAVRAPPLPDLPPRFIEREGDVDALVRVNPDRVII